jgi:hypothetical protein
MVKMSEAMMRTARSARTSRTARPWVSIMMVYR